MSDSKIEWTSKTWNPAIRGCSKASAGCRECYAMKFAHRFSGPGQRYEGLTVLRKSGPEWSGKVVTGNWNLTTPIRWRKPQKVFVNSMSDLFHEDVPFDVIDDVFGVMWACLYLGRGENVYPGHTFQILTKRAERMAEYTNQDRRKQWARAAVTYGGGADADAIFDQVMLAEGQHPRIHLGVSVEDQPNADARVPWLAISRAAVKFVSAEPLIGPVDFSAWMMPPCIRNENPHLAFPYPFGEQVRPFDWVIVGGESGPGARPCHVAWVTAIQAQCKTAGVPVFTKQLGLYPIIEDPVRIGLPRAQWPEMEWPEGTFFGNRTGISSLNGCQVLLRDPKGGDVSEWPERLRIREFPVVAA